MSIFWANSPPAELTSSAIRVHWVKRGETSTFQLLAAVQGVWTHWIDPKTMPCAGDACAYCSAGIHSKWVGYVPALHYLTSFELAEVDRTNAAGDKIRKVVNQQRGRWSAVVLEVTEGMNAYLKGRPLRGLVIRCTRDSARRNGPVRALVIDQAGAPDLPPAFDVRPILLRMWGVREKPKAQQVHA